jgi:gluconate kinase
MHQRVPTLLLTGPSGSGKTAVAAELGLVLEERGTFCAVVDLDWLGWVHAGPGFKAFDRLIARNLAAIWPNLEAAGARRLVLARRLMHRELLDELPRALPAAEVKVVRLTASRETVEERLRRRDTGEVLDEHLEEARSQLAAMDELALEDAKVATDGLPVREIAIAVMRAAGWE